MTKVINETFRANAKTLAVFDEEMEDLAKENVSAALSAISKDRKMPFWYSAYGEDKLPGVLVTSNGEADPSVGYVRTQSDAVFVATGINVAYDAGAGDIIPVIGFPSAFGVRLYDESNYRWITLTNSSDNGQRESSLPAWLLDSDWSLKQSGFPLSNEVVFPRNAVIRVEIFSQQPGNVRIYFSLSGYKVFGG
jgi:hypothetical protein